MFGNQPKTAEEVNAEGLKLAQSDQLASALKKFEEAVKIDPNFVFAHNNIGNCYRYTNRPYEALGAYTRAIEIKPDFDDAYYNRAVVYESLGELENAIADYEAYRNVGGTRRRNNEARIEDLLSKLRLRIQIRDQTRPAPQAIPPMSDEVLTLMERGHAYYKRRQFEEALVVASEAIELDDQQPGLYNLRGGIYMRLEEFQTAAEDIVKALNLAPDFPEALANRASLLEWAEDAEGAIRDFSRAIELRPDSAAFRAARAWLNRHFDVQSALTDINFALEQMPGDPLLYFRRGVLLNMESHFAEAIEDYSEAHRIAPDMVDVYPARALALAALGRMEEAKVDLQTYLDIGGGGDMSLDDARRYLEAMKMGVK